MSTAALIGALLAFLGVALGAFGAHGLSTRVQDEQIKTYQTGVQYQLIHGVAAWAAGMFAAILPRAGLLPLAAWLFIVGIVLFSGSLYALTAERLPRRLGVITPIGGLCFLAGWALLALQMLHGV